MRHTKHNLLFILIIFIGIIFTACSSKETATPVVQNQSVNNETKNPPESAATYKYIDPSAVISVSRIDESNDAKWRNLTTDKDTKKVENIVSMVNSGIDRKEPTKTQVEVFKSSHPSGISIKFKDESIVKVYPVYDSYKNGKLEKVSEDLYFFENIVGKNVAYFTISSRDMVNYLLKGLDKDFKTDK